MTTLDRVFVRNADGSPLAPTKRFARVRKMLRDGEATVFSHDPFTIQFTTQHDTGPVAQMSLGIDIGSKHVGLSVVDGTQEHLAIQVDLLEDESRRIAKRREARRTRRHYTVEHRKPRFDNRRRTDGWLPPSIQHKLDTHKVFIQLACEILPIDRVHVESPAFDTHKIADPDVAGEGYAEGLQKGFRNVREYVLERDGHVCQAPGCTETRNLQVHHIESRLTGGDAPGNLVTLCPACHKKHHAGKLDLSHLKRSPSLRDASQASVIGSCLVRDLADELPSNVELFVTCGYETAAVREEAGLEKTHVVDARVIAGGAGVQPAGRVFRCRKVRRHNRQYYKSNLLKGGHRKANTVVGEVYGFRRYDVVLVDGKEECWIDGLRSSGYFKLRRFDGSLVVTSKASSKKSDSSVSRKRLTLVRHSRGYLSWSEEV